MFEPRVFDALGFNLTGEASIQYGASLGVWEISEIWESIQEVGRSYRPPRLRNRLFPKPI